MKLIIKQGQINVGTFIWYWYVDTRVELNYAKDIGLLRLSVASNGDKNECFRQDFIGCFFTRCHVCYV